MECLHIVVKQKVKTNSYCFVHLFLILSFKDLIVSHIVPQRTEIIVSYFIVKYALI